MNEIKYILTAIKLNIQNNAELRVTFILNVLGMVMNNLFILASWFLFAKAVPSFNGWGPNEVILLHGIAAFSIGLVIFLGGGLMRLPGYIASGQLDQFLISPKNLIARIATSYLAVGALGDVVYGIMCIVYYLAISSFTVWQAIALPCILAMAVLSAFFTLLAIHSISFDPMNAEMISNSLFELYLTPSLFHGGAIQGIIRAVFIVIIPSLLVGTIPVEAFKAMHLNSFLIIGASVLFWGFVSVKLFYRGLSKYTSANLNTFGA